MVTAVVGANWGDEGKGKITDLLAEDANVVIRFQGGANAGHTIINNYGRFALHTLPSGVFNSKVVNVIGNGVALDIEKLLKEIEDVKSKGVPFEDNQLVISDRTQILMPYHIMQDKFEEERLGKNSFGSTKSGIAPFYSDKYAKMGIQVCDLYYPERLRKRVDLILDYKNRVFNGLYNKFTELNAAVLTDQLIKWGKQIKPYVKNLSIFLNEEIKKKHNILLEGQLGSLKDPDFGIYPMVTSSHTIAGFGCVGAGIGPTKIDNVIAVTKAYSSCVGSSTEPFVSELLGVQGDELRRRGGDKGEFGATTGRPRRVGWFDVVATKYGCRVQGATEVALTCLDVLSYLDEIPICVGYNYKGEILNDFPVTPILEECTPVYKIMPGWKCDIRGTVLKSELPYNAKRYVNEIQGLVGLPINIISTGPDRDETIIMHNQRWL